MIQDQGATTLRDTLRNVAGISIRRPVRAALREIALRSADSPLATISSSTECATLAATIAIPLTCRKSPCCRARRRLRSGAVQPAASSIRRPRLRRPLVSSPEPWIWHRPDQARHGGSRSASALSGEWNRFPAEPDGPRFEVRRTRYCREPPLWRRSSLAFGLGTPTRFTLSYLREGADDTPDYGIPWLFNGPAPVERRNYYGFEHGNYLKTTVDMGTVKFEHDVNSHITFRNQARYAHYHRDVRITEPQIDATTLDPDP